jgi:hypothetical protein
MRPLLSKSLATVLLVDASTVLCGRLWMTYDRVANNGAISTSNVLRDIARLLLPECRFIAVAQALRAARYCFLRQS